MTIMNPRRVLAAALAAAAALLGACQGASAPAPSVVVTTNILGDITRRIVGDQVDVLTLMPPDSDPHSFGVSAKEALAMQNADLLVANGLGLEEGLNAHVEAARSHGVPVFEAGAHVRVLEYSSDDASGPDPHLWTDPAQMLAVVDALEKDIAAHVEGIDAQALAQRADAYEEELRALDASMEEAFATIPPERRALVTNHHVFGYLAERYDFDLVGAIIPGGATLASPSASDLADLADTITRARVPAIFAESSSPAELAEALARQAGLEVEVVSLYTESLTDERGEAPTYLDMMRVNTERIVGALAP